MQNFTLRELAAINTQFIHIHQSLIDILNHLPDQVEVDMHGIIKKAEKLSNTYDIHLQEALSATILLSYVSYRSDALQINEYTGDPFEIIEAGFAIHIVDFINEETRTHVTNFANKFIDQNRDLKPYRWKSLKEKLKIVVNRMRL